MSKKIQLVVFFIIIFVGVYIINYLTPFSCDEYTASFSFANGKRLKSWFDIFSSIHAFYFSWSGRLVANFLIQFFLIFQKSVFNFFNSIVYILFVIGVYININYEIRKKFSKIKLLLVLTFILWFLTPKIGETYFWLSGSINYTWMTTIALYFTFYFKNNWFLRQQNIFYLILLFFLGLIVGLTHESIAVPVFLANCVFLYLNNKNNKIEKQSFIILFGLLIGMLILMLAPGNFARATGLENLFEKFIAKQFSRKILIIILFSFFSLSIFIGRNKFFIHLKNYSYEFYISIFSFGIMLFSPEFPQRARFCFMIYFIIFLFNTILSIKITEKNFKKNILQRIIFLIICILFFIDYSFAFKNSYETNKRFKQSEKIIYESREKIVIVPSRILKGRHKTFFSYLGLDFNSSESKDMQRYYNKEKILFLDSYIFDNFYLENKVRRKIHKILF
ncbi:MAG: DUF6056 family protein [Fusobacteriaceae bacterium]